ncbi:calcium-binding protein [Natrialbaceae archaeon A-gly3]
MQEDSTDDSRREFMKKGTLAATALAVGAGAASTSATAQEEEGEVVIHSHDYFPGGEFTVMAELATLAKDDLLENLDEDEVVFDDLNDWDAYIIQIEAGEAGPLGHLMVEENGEIRPSPGDTGTMDERATVRDPGLNLLELDVTLEEADDEEDDEEDDEADDEEDDE